MLSPLKIYSRLKLRFKLLFFLIFYSLFFYFLRNSDYYDYRLLKANIDSIPWLYAAISQIFGIISAFIIQKEWQQWDELVDAVKGENNALYEMWLWSSNFQTDYPIRPLIKQYLSIVIREGWAKTEDGEVSQELDKVIKSLHEGMAAIARSHPAMSSAVFNLLSNLGTYREKRIRFGSSHMPKILLSTFRFATCLMIFLCPLIAIKEYELHFLFSVSISVLAYTIYIVTRDMDQPLKPGGWHLTTADYQKLLDKLEAASGQ
jgi:hypothetical protein